jgi:hypothetical protein
MRSLVLLGGLAASLAMVVAVELVTPLGADDATGVRPAVRLPAVDPARAAAQAEDRTDAWVATIMARPLFTRDRRPVGEHATAAAGGGKPLPRLTGIAISPFGRSAIFAPDGGKPLVVSEGDNVDGFTVRAIHPGAVDIEGPGGSRTVAPAFDPNPHVDIPVADQTEQPGQNVPQVPGVLPPGFRGMPLPQFRNPQGTPMLPGLRPRGNGAELTPSPFDRPRLTAQLEPAQRPGPIAP